MRTILAVAVFVATGACSGGDAQDAPPDAQWKLVENHFFIERMPKNARDMIHQLAFVRDEDGRHRLGVRGHSSQVRVFLDIIAWNRDGSRLTMKTLQTGDDSAATFRARECNMDGFEICLELREGERTRRYFSRHDWIIESVEQAQHLATHELLRDPKM